MTGLIRSALSCFDVGKLLHRKTTWFILCICQVIFFLGLNQLIFRTKNVQVKHLMIARRNELSRLNFSSNFIKEVQQAEEVKGDWSRNLDDQGQGQTQPNDCVGKRFSWQAEDLLCIERPVYLPEYKNPCFYEVRDDGVKTLRCLPYFHLLGADKCGTTDLFDRILQHPQVEACTCGWEKESYYWCWLRYGVWMKKWYGERLQLFRDYLRAFDAPAKYILGNVTDGHHYHITGDGTPMDFWDFRGWPKIPQNLFLDEPVVLTPHLMRHFYTSPKFLLILRNPTERLYSDYYFMEYGDSPDSFHNHSVQAVAMLEQCFRRRTVRHCLYSSRIYADLPARIHIGCYSVLLREWLGVFSREHFLILRTEDYHTGNKQHLQQVFQFLELSELTESRMDEISRRDRKHETVKKRMAGPMRTDTRQLLDKFYSTFNTQLADMLHDRRFLWKD